MTRGIYEFNLEKSDKDIDSLINLGDCFLYFVYDFSSNLTKIGITKNLHNRLLTIKTYNPTTTPLFVLFFEKASSKIVFSIEQGLHIIFADERYYNEWFLLNIDHLKSATTLFGLDLQQMYPKISESSNIFIDLEDLIINDKYIEFPIISYLEIDCNKLLHDIIFHKRSHDDPTLFTPSGTSPLSSSR